MTAPSPLLAVSAERLAAALHEVPGLGYDLDYWRGIADNLIARGAVVPAASLADDEALWRRLAAAVDPSAGRHRLRDPSRSRCRLGGPMSDAVRHQPKCPSCQATPESWTVRRLAHSGERALECPSCGTVLTEDFLRDVWGVTLPESVPALEDR